MFLQIGWLCPAFGGWQVEASGQLCSGCERFVLSLGKGLEGLGKSKIRKLEAPYRFEVRGGQGPTNAYPEAVGKPRVVRDGAFVCQAQIWR